MALDGFAESSFTHDGATYPVFRRGEGPGVVVMHEVPGITPAVARYGARVAEAGFTAVLPSLFGTPGKDYIIPYDVSSLARACVSREFDVLAHNRSSPITDWLRALCRAVHGELGGRGVGAIGMCITGNFALALMVEPCLMAPILSQPSLPFPLGRKRRASLHLSDEALAVIRRRAQEEGIGVLGMRFTGDPLCPRERFERLRDELGDGFEGIEIDSTWGNAAGVSRIAHSVVAFDLVDEDGHPTRRALDRTIAFLRERLLVLKPEV